MKHTLLTSMLFFGLLGTASADLPPNVIEVKVKGLVCSFCVQGVEKLLKDLPGVQKLEIKLSKQTVYLTVQSTDRPTEDAIRKAVKAAGYDVEAIVRAGDPKTSPPVAEPVVEGGT